MYLTSRIINPHQQANHESFHLCHASKGPYSTLIVVILWEICKLLLGLSMGNQFLSLSLHTTPAATMGVSVLANRTTGSRSLTYANQLVATVQ